MLGNRESLAAKGSSHASSLRNKRRLLGEGGNSEEMLAMIAQKVETV